MGDKKLTPEEAAAMQNGNKPVTPNQGNQNQAFRRLLATLMGEERRWQPKGTPSKGHIFGRLARDLFVPWLANEINYHIDERNKRQEAEAWNTAKGESIRAQLEQPIHPELLGRVTNPDVRAQIQKEIGATPQPTPQQLETPEYVRQAAQNAIVGDLSNMRTWQKSPNAFAYFPRGDEDWNSQWELDAIRAKNKVRNPLAGRQEDFDWRLPIWEETGLYPGLKTFFDMPESNEQPVVIAPYREDLQKRALEFSENFPIKGLFVDVDAIEDLKKRGY